jgi:hypothetical protein
MCREGAGLAIGGEHDRRCQDRFPTLFVTPFVVVFIDLLKRPHIRIRVAGDSVVLDVKFPGPFVVYRISGPIGSVDDAFVPIALACINKTRDLVRSTGYF